MTLVILNLFVAVVLDGFDGSAVGEEEAIVQKCIEVWFRHDHNVDLLLPIMDVKRVMEDIEVEFVMEQGWKPLPPAKNKLIKDARYYVHDFMDCQDGRVSFLNATLGSMLVLLCHTRVHEYREGKWSDLAIEEVKKQIEEIREVSRYAFKGDKMPRNRGEQAQLIEKWKVEAEKVDHTDAEMLEGKNFRAHLAAVSMQEKFREKAVKRAKEARARSTLKLGAKQIELAKQLEAAANNPEAEDGADEGAKDETVDTPGLPGGVPDDDASAPPLKPAVAG
jgi:hypothetical protein